MENKEIKCKLFRNCCNYGWFCAKCKHNEHASLENYYDKYEETSEYTMRYA